MTITAPETDPGMTLVESWLSVVFPSVAELVGAAAGKHGGVEFTEFTSTVGTRAALQYRCAVALAARRLSPTPFRFFSWLSHLAWNEPIDPPVAEHLRVPLLVNLGTRQEPGNEDHALGLVAETLWYELTRATTTPDGSPLLVEAHDWSVTDPGGDGLAVYRIGGDLRFTLWESKAHYSAQDVRQTVNGACRQLRSRAPDYLGRFSVVAQRLAPDEETARFLCLMSEHWADRSPSARVAVSVSTQVGANCSDCFKSMTNYFDFPDDRHSGRLFRISDYRKFALGVRELIWRGADL
jgi:hypothetical protein